MIELSIHDLASRFDAGASRAWFCSSDTGVGSFLWACDAVGLDHEAARDKISKLRPADIRRRDARIANNGPPPRGQKSDKFKSVYAFKIHRDKRNPLCDLDFSSLLSLSTERLQDRVELNDADPVNHFLGTS